MSDMEIVQVIKSKGKVYIEWRKGKEYRQEIRQEKGILKIALRLLKPRVNGSKKCG